MEEKFEAMLTKRFAQFEVHFAILASTPMLVQGFNRFENSVLSLTQSVASVTNKISNVEQAVDGLAARVAAFKITSIEQIVGSLLARVTTLETCAASGSSALTRQMEHA